jgi:hypothetical protein
MLQLFLNDNIKVHVKSNVGKSVVIVNDIELGSIFSKAKTHHMGH